MSNLTFADYFKVSKQQLEEYGAVNPCIAYDLPLFIDPFLIFVNKKYKNLHSQIIKYMRFLYEETKNIKIADGRYKHLFVFSEIKQTWFGLSENDNNGRSGANKLGLALKKNLKSIFKEYDYQEISNVIHLEEISLIEKGIGKDCISDFTTRLILDYLLEYTQKFTVENIGEDLRKEFPVGKAIFDYKTKTWMAKNYILPKYENDFVILVPSDIVAREELWLNKIDMFASYEYLPPIISNDELRSTLNNYFYNNLPVRYNKDYKRKAPTRKEKEYVSRNLFERFPEARKFYLKFKEENKKLLLERDKTTIIEISKIIPELASQLAIQLKNELKVKKVTRNSYEEALLRIKYLKKIIEKQDCYKYFYSKGLIIRREEDLHRYFKAVWFDTEFDVNAEVNNGRGSVDFKISNGSDDQTVIEFKLASNTQLKDNLENQAEIYAEANNNPNVIKVILYFTLEEETKLNKILKSLNLANKENVITIDARSDNKISASKVKKT